MKLPILASAAVTAMIVGVLASAPARAASPEPPSDSSSYRFKAYPGPVPQDVPTLEEVSKNLPAERQRILKSKELKTVLVDSKTAEILDVWAGSNTIPNRPDGRYVVFNAPWLALLSPTTEALPSKPELTDETAHNRLRFRPLGPASRADGGGPPPLAAGLPVRLS